MQLIQVKLNVKRTSKQTTIRNIKFEPQNLKKRTFVFGSKVEKY